MGYKMITTFLRTIKPETFIHEPRPHFDRANARRQARQNFDELRLGKPNAALYPRTK